MKMRMSIFVTALAVIASPAIAFDLNKNITQLNGRLLTDQFGKETVQMTVADAIVNALLTTDQNTKPEDKGKRFWLAIKIREAAEKKKDPLLTPQEITEIETDLDKYQSILVAGQVKREIDPSFTPEEHREKVEKK